MPKSSVLRNESRHSKNETIAKKSHVSISETPQGIARWLKIMRQFSGKHKEKCSVSNQPQVVRPKVSRPTGSTYEGSWNVLGGRSGYGIYTFSNGVVYEGGFQDGEFEGVGELRYRSGVSVKGKWEKGAIVERTVVFDNGLEYEVPNWKYCSYPDRRFTIEIDDHLQPAGRSNLTADQPTRKIPPGYYDTGYGFYDSVDTTIYEYNNINDFIKFPERQERLFIKRTCRKNPEDSIDRCDFLYERWMPPLLEPEFLPPPSVHTKTNERRDSGNLLSGTFMRSTSRIRLSENNRLSIRSCGGVREFYNKSYLDGGIPKRSYSDQVLAHASTASRTDKIVLRSINTLIAKSDSFLLSKSKKSLLPEVNKSALRSSVKPSKEPKPTLKQLINW